MAATIYPFTPSVASVFSFQPTLDGNVYLVQVKWNLFGQRYYVWIWTLGGTLVVSLPLVGSPNGYDISLTGGYFSTKMVFRAPASQFEVG